MFLSKLVILIILLNFIDFSESRVCNSIDIRNHKSQFQKLRGCDIVVGFVHIILFEDSTWNPILNEHYYDNLSFPELKEITHYLLIYRVHKLPSLGKLFPNLAVIRGYVPFVNYALVIYENPDLTSIDLINLTEILRGSVRIEKNPKLCYVKTINWKMMGPRTDNVIGDNMSDEVCKHKPRCMMCPDGRCWNHADCQRSRTYVDFSCSSECLGGCYAPNDSRACFACKNKRIGNRCAEFCDASSYVYEDHLCVSRDECTRFYRYVENEVVQTFPFLFQCDITCPKHYVKTTADQGYCTACYDCGKKCKGGLISHTANAQLYRGCTVINGSLEIEDIHHPLAESELYRSLESLEEITGYLKISNTVYLNTLYFLPKLKVIRGNELIDDRYSIVIKDNQKLSKLFPLDLDGADKKVSILRGRPFLHFNPLLCLSEVRYLIKSVATFKNFTTLEVSSSTNGDQTVCDEVMIHSNSTVLNSTSVEIVWEHVNASSHMYEMIGYHIFYKPVGFEKQTVYSQYAGPCMKNDWSYSSYDFEGNRIISDQLSYVVTDLEPSTRYAYYIKSALRDRSVLLGKTHNGGDISQIQYFFLPSGTPSRPTKVKTRAISDKTIEISWNKPYLPSGILTYYYITAYLQEEDVDQLDKRNYCNLPMVEPKKRDEKLEECSCDIKDKLMKEDFVEYEVMYKGRKYSSQNSRPSKKYLYLIRNNTVKVNGTRISVYCPDNIMALNFTGLSTYSLYMFMIEACNKIDDDTETCSSPYLITQRTLSELDIDMVSNFQVTPINGSRSAVVYWEEPTEKNVAILYYTIEYWPLNKATFQMRQCITRIEHKAHFQEYFIDNLDDGFYTIRIRATSLAGNGHYSTFTFFVNTAPWYASIEFWKRQWITLLIIFLVFVTLVILCTIAYSPTEITFHDCVTLRTSDFDNFFEFDSRLWSTEFGDLYSARCRLTVTNKPDKTEKQIQRCYVFFSEENVTFGEIGPESGSNGNETSTKPTDDKTPLLEAEENGWSKDSSSEPGPSGLQKKGTSTDVLSEAGPSGVQKKSPTKTSPTRKSPTKTSPTKKSPMKTSPTKRSPSKEFTSYEEKVKRLSKKHDSADASPLISTAADTEGDETPPLEEFQEGIPMQDLSRPDRKNLELALRQNIMTQEQAPRRTPPLGEIYEGLHIYQPTVEAIEKPERSEESDKKSEKKEVLEESVPPFGVGSWINYVMPVVVRKYLFEQDKKAIAKKKQLELYKHKFFFEKSKLLRHCHTFNILRVIGYGYYRHSRAFIFEHYITDLRTELVSKGFLNTLRKKVQYTVPNAWIHQFAKQIADGMTYLTYKNIVHKDLAARNIMLCKNFERFDQSPVAKISDTGYNMLNNIKQYGYIKKGMFEHPYPMPIKWMAPETFLREEWTSASDVWSYGVLLWEMFSNGQEPFDEWYDSQVIDYVCKGKNHLIEVDLVKLLPFPAVMDQRMFDLVKIMHACFEFEPNRRITFVDVMHYFTGGYTETNIFYCSFEERQMRLKSRELLMMSRVFDLRPYRYSDSLLSVMMKSQVDILNDARKIREKEENRTREGLGLTPKTEDTSIRSFFPRMSRYIEFRNRRSSFRRNLRRNRAIEDIIEEGEEFAMPAREMSPPFSQTSTVDEQPSIFEQAASPLLRTSESTTSDPNPPFPLQDIEMAPISEQANIQQSQASEYEETNF